MKIHENFARCEKCGGGWFEEKVAVLIPKGSDKNPLMFLKKQTTYRCVQCGHPQYQKEEDPKQ